MSGLPSAGNVLESAFASCTNPLHTEGPEPVGRGTQGRMIPLDGIRVRSGAGPDCPAIQTGLETWILDGLR